MGTLIWEPLITTPLEISVQLRSRQALHALLCSAGPFGFALGRRAGRPSRHYL
jgi:hypothetical protein